MRPVRVSVYNEGLEVGKTMTEIPLTPTMRMFVKRIHDDREMDVRGYIVVRVGFVPFGTRLSDLQNECQMDELSTADFLGMRRKYAEVCAQNNDFQSAIAVLQDKVRVLGGKRFVPLYFGRSCCQDENQRKTDKNGHGQQLRSMCADGQTITVFHEAKECCKRFCNQHCGQKIPLDIRIRPSTRDPSRSSQIDDLEGLKKYTVQT